MHPEQLQLNSARFLAGRSGMALFVVLMALLVFGVIMFGVSHYQVHETRWTAMAIEREKAFILADAGISRALARHVARKFAKRWYGPPPGQTDDLLPSQNHAGRFDESSQGHDEGAAGAATGDQKLDPHGTYSTLVEDRFVGESDQVPSTPQTNLDYTDVFARGTVDGPQGRVNALVFARIAIAPEVNYFTPDENASEMIKKIIRYKVTFEPQLADRTYENPGTDTADARNRVHEEVALFHQYFLKNRDTFADLRKNVNAGWNAPAAGKSSYTRDEIIAMFSGLRPIQNPTFASTDGKAHNLWIDAMVRNVQISDLLGPNKGFKYLISTADLPPPDSEIVAKNILLAFHGRTIDPVPDRFKEGASNPVTDGNDLLGLQNSQSFEDSPKTTYCTEISTWKRLEAEAYIIKGHYKPYPTPTTTAPIDPSTVGREFADSVFLDSFKSASPAIPMSSIVAQMRAECDRVNTMLGSNLIDRNSFVQSPPPALQYYPIQLRLDEPAAAPYAQIPVAELVKFYDKYIESAATFSGGDPGSVLPPPPVPRQGPAETPDGPGPSSTSSPHTGPGSGVAGPTKIGGRAAGT